jgi:hypothetical protein
MCNQNIISNKFDLNLSTTLSSYNVYGSDTWDILLPSSLLFWCPLADVDFSPASTFKVKQSGKLLRFTKVDFSDQNFFLTRNKFDPVTPAALTTLVTLCLSTT